MRFLSWVFFTGLSGCALADWQMFADMDNTYLYNTITGEVYVKHSMGGPNYEDVFVKMPKGVSSPRDLPAPQKSRADKAEQEDLAPLKSDSLQEDKKAQNEKEAGKKNSSKQQEEDLKMESIKKAQEMMLKSLDTGE